MGDIFGGLYFIFLGGGGFIFLIILEGKQQMLGQSLRMKNKLQ